MNLKSIMLSERSHTQRLLIVLFYLYEIAREGKFVEAEGRSAVS